MEQVVKAQVTKLSSFYSTSYNEQFRIPTSDILKITNNGGNYPYTSLNYLIDDQTSTHWETLTKNSDSFQNEIVFTLKDTTTLNRIVYSPRETGAAGKGAAREFEIYASKQDSGENFTLVTTGEYAGSTTDKLEIQFEPTECKRVKFVFKKASENWAAASEFMFYKEDSVKDKFTNLFTDKTMTEVNETYTKDGALNDLEASIEGHPLYDTFKADIDYAKKIINGELNFVGTMITAEQVGDRRATIYNHLRMDMGSNLQPTGFAALAGQTINVYVEAGGSKNVPSIIFTQQEGTFANYQRSISLKEGKNVITVPTLPKDQFYRYDVVKGGAIYITNPYAPDQQNRVPIVRIEGAQKFPLMTKETSPETFRNELIAYTALLAKDKQENPDLVDRKIIDIVEMVSDHVILTGTTTRANKAFVLGNTNPLDVVNGYDNWMHKFFSFHGLDGRSEKHDPTLIRESIRLMQPWGYMYAAGDHTGIQYEQDALLMVDLGKSYAGWGLNHEIGHRIDIHARELGEITNNMTSMAMSVAYNSLDNRIPYDNTIYKNVIEENKVQASSLDLATRLGAFWQIELAYPGYWTDLESLYRERKITVSSQSDKEQTLIQLSSEAVGKDLSSHFARHGYTISEETKQATSVYEETKNIWYLNNTVIHYKGNGFTIAATLDGNVVVNEANNTLTFSVDEAAKADLLGYEIKRDGKVIAFTRSTSYVDTTVEANTTYTYEIVAYDKKLNTISHTIEPSNEEQTKTNMNLIIEEVTAALSDSNVNLSDIKAIVAGNPPNTTFSGLETELYVKNKLESQFASIPGTFEMVIHNSTDSQTVEEMINKDLTITYQLDEMEPTYIYKKGKISVQK